MLNRSSRLLRLLLVPLTLVLLAPETCVAPPFASDGPIRFVYWVLEGKTRVGRTSFEFRYRVAVQNTSARDAFEVAASVESTAVENEIIDGELSFDPIASGEIGISTNTLVVRQDRSTPLRPADLEWDIRGRTPTRLVIAEEADAVTTGIRATSPRAPISDDDVVVGADGSRFLGNRLEVEFSTGTTFAQADALLAALGAEVTSALDGYPAIVVGFPGTATIEELDGVVSAFEAEPEVDRVVRTWIRRDAALPPGIADAFELSADQPALATHRLPAAWNANAAVLVPPSVALMDHFGLGEPITDIGASTVVTSDYTLNLADPGSLHGYRVLGPLLGAWPASLVDPLRAKVKGALPLPVPLLRAVDLRSGLGAAEADNEMFQRLQTMFGRVVLNISQGDGCSDTFPITSSCALSIQQEAEFFAVKMRFFGLEDRVLVVVSAGNESTDAALSSTIAASALDIASPLANVLVVEGVKTRMEQPHRPRCLSESSNTNGTISGAEDWLTFSGPLVGTEIASGTSFSSPAVASIAALVWSVRPDLTAPQLAELLVATGGSVPGSSGTDCSLSFAAPLVDAYAALLSLDVVGGTGGSTVPDAPVRLAVLDADFDGDFDEFDVETIVESWNSSASPGEVVDFSRFDLNGDGYSGGVRSGRFDLNAPASTQFSSPNLSSMQTVEFDGGESVTFNEFAATDSDVLCYYTQTGLYSGAQTPLENIENFHCLPDDEGGSPDEICAPFCACNCRPAGAPIICAPCATPEANPFCFCD